jgi:hypothetical protein
MSRKPGIFQPVRREFLAQILPAGAMVCLGCSPLLAFRQTKEKDEAMSQKHKFMEDTHLTFTEVFQFSIQAGYIPIMKEPLHVSSGFRQS